MGVVVDGIASASLHYPVWDSTPECYAYLSEEYLIALETERKQRRSSVSLVGKKREQETGYFYVNAWMLGVAAIELGNQENDHVIAVLFRDTDGTRSTVVGLWEAKWRSMEDGFQRSGIGRRGVPMLPKPKSEAWLLCAAKKDPYVNCAVLEHLPGNDESPNSAKSQLRQRLNGKASTVEQVEWLLTQAFDVDAVARQMPSFAAFISRMSDALHDVMRNALRPTGPPVG